MKTLNDFKNEVAKENGYENYKQIFRTSKFSISDCIELAAERYAEYMCICFCEELKDYTRESKTILGHDERSAKKLYDIFRQNKH